MDDLLVPAAPAVPGPGQAKLEPLDPLDPLELLELPPSSSPLDELLLELEPLEELELPAELEELDSLLDDELETPGELEDTIELLDGVGEVGLSVHPGRDAVPSNAAPPERSIRNSRRSARRFSSAWASSAEVPPARVPSVSSKSTLASRAFSRSTCPRESRARTQVPPSSKRLTVTHITR